MFCYTPYRFLNAQCDCTGNSAEIALSNLNEIYHNDSLRYNNFYINLLYKYTYADSYFLRDVNIGRGAIKSIAAHFLDLRLSYKYNFRWIFDIELGYFINKRQTENLKNQSFNASGISDLSILGRYILWKDIANNFEISGGGGIKVPFAHEEATIPQNIQPSTGAYAILANILVKKYFPDWNLGLIAGNRTDYNFENKWRYRYGISTVSSIILLYNAGETINIGTELRGDFRGKDYNKGKKICGSGFIALSISPILRINTGRFIIGSFFNYPFYQFYFGKQIANKFSFGMSISYGTKLFD